MGNPGLRAKRGLWLKPMTLCESEPGDILLKNKKSVPILLEWVYERTVTLAEIKKEKKFKDWDLLRISRLSVMPVPKEIWDKILEISQAS
jgi:hypothetical protein